MTEKKKEYNATDTKTLAKLDKLAIDIVKKVAGGQIPSVSIPSRTKSNSNYDEKNKIIKMGDKTSNRKFSNLNQSKAFMQLLLIAEKCKHLIEAGVTTSIRDVYYDAKHTMENKENTFDDQAESDPIIEDLEVFTGALREQLHLRAENRGALVGNMTIIDGGDTINLRTMGTGGWSVPSIVENNVIQFGETEAKFVLYVEKGAVWSRLNEDKFWRTMNCMLIHGGGMASRGVRRMLRRMREELKLPVFVITDCDPWGFYIYSVIKQGSMSLSFESERMAVPDAKFLGVSIFDVNRFAIPNSTSIKLEDGDIQKCEQIKAYPWFKQQEWQKEINEMLRVKKKYEIEALSAKGIKFITQEYIPKKLKDKLWY